MLEAYWVKALAFYLLSCYMPSSSMPSSNQSTVMLAEECGMQPSALSHAEAEHGHAGTHREPNSVVVAMCTYQGAQFVEAQMQSLLTQSWPVSLHISDDVSSDQTSAMAQSLIRPDVDTLVVQEHNLGYVRNFESSIKAALASGAAYIALSDQDDVCHVDRIERAMKLMQDMQHKHGEQSPLLVHSDLRLVDAEGEQYHPSFLRYRRYRISSEKNLPVVLGENGVMGNTIVMNRALAELCLPFPEHLHVHDYWIAILAELFGHRALVSSPTVDYRLHGNNASNTAESMDILNRRQAMSLTWSKLSMNASRLLSRDYKLPFKEDSRLAVLQHLLKNKQQYPALNSSQIETLTEFVEYLKFEQPRWRSLLYLLCSGVARTSFRYRLRLCLATLLTQRYAKN